jgi:hypothetical protein
MKKTVLFALCLCFLLSACSKNADNTANETPSDDIKITDWDNSKYEAQNDMFKYSIGLNVVNDNSPEPIDANSDTVFAELNTLYIDDINAPITLEFDSNGKDRNFIVTVYYDYVPIPFKISRNGEYSYTYKFDLEAGKLIELPMFLPNDTDTEGLHKLFVSFVIGYDMHTSDLNLPTADSGIEEHLTWYGYGTVLDVIYGKNELDGAPPFDVDYEKIENTVDLQYAFEINQDYDFDILQTGILKPMANEIAAKSGSEAVFTYNASNVIGGTVEDFLVLLTVDFEQAPINGKGYELIHIPGGKTGIKEMRFTVPVDMGKHEVFAYLIPNPFKQYALGDISGIEFSQRFTLNVGP